ncbi:MAG: DUF2973 domain-containing protein [Coleofasciculus sp. B1-GNL1-01]|uniref:DUF2973 domain-containing protein n=1 Tax=Coleofasciculus sp. B1-GNL1-01 TaxID=3068484 RepID=UPI0032F28928
MLHLLYIIAFTVIAFLAIRNLIRSLLNLSIDAQRHYAPAGKASFAASSSSNTPVPHPELLDDTGNPTSEPLLVMKSMTVEDARTQLDALYDASPSNSIDKSEDI